MAPGVATDTPASAVPHSTISSRSTKQISPPTTPTSPLSSLTILQAAKKKPNFENETDRLQSFGTWPSTAPISKDKVARAGFYYLGNALEVACPFCKIEVSDWAFNDVALKKHSERSPRCPFVLTRQPVKIPFEELMKDPRRRIETFRNWPKPQIDPQRLVNAGFYFLNEGDKTRCAWCKGVVQEWNPEDVPFEVHAKLFTCCSFVLNPPSYVTRGEDECGSRNMCNPMSRTSTSKTQRQGGVIPHQAPKHPNMISSSSRMKTFESQSWPSATEVTPESLVEAGFFYLGTQDFVKCFHCDGGLCNWEKEDRPWVEHARWFPNCTFVILNQGDAFIAECKRAHHQMLSEASSAVEEQSQDGNLPPHLRAEMDAIMRSEAVKYFLDNSVPEPMVRMTLKKFMLDNQRGFQSNNELSLVLCQSLSFKNGPAIEDKAATHKDPEDIPENVLCRVCMARERGVVFLPCGHLATCPSCAASVTECVVCRTKITSTLRTFLS